MLRDAPKRRPRFSAVALAKAGKCLKSRQEQTECAWVSQCCNLTFYSTLTGKYYLLINGGPIPAVRAGDAVAVSVGQSLIIELEEAIQSGSKDKRVDALRRITDLFVADADRLTDQQIDVFDDSRAPDQENRIQGARRAQPPPCANS